MKKFHFFAISFLISLSIFSTPNLTLAANEEYGIAASTLGLGATLGLGIWLTNHNHHDNGSPTPTPLNFNYHATFTLDSSYQEARSTGRFRAHITIANISNQSIKNWGLGFNFIRKIISYSGAIEKQHFGDFYLITPDGSSKQTIPPNSSYTFNIIGDAWIEHYTDAPAGYFIVIDNQPTQDIASDTVLPNWQPDRGQDTFTQNDNHQKQSPPDPDPTLQTSLIVPLPVKTIRNGTPSFTLTANTRILYNNDEAKTTAEFLAAALRPATGFPLPVLYSENVQSGDVSLEIIHKDTNDLKNKEAYSLFINDQKIGPNAVVINAINSAGLFYGAQSLRQLLPKEIFQTTKQASVSWTIPAVDIFDKPRFAYRGMMLDVARHFRTVDDVKHLLDAAALLKLNVFHWHLTDDEGWRVALSQYPTLTRIGGYRGFNLPLQPTFGSGSNPYGGFYSQTQIRDIVNYANQRHIAVIPEIDMPGHARAMIKSLPQQLIDTTDQSAYTSIQGYHDNVLSACVDPVTNNDQQADTYTVIDKIFQTISSANFFGDQHNDLYGYSNFINIGSDEVPTGVWDPAKAPNCAAVMSKYNLKNAAALQHFFIKQVRIIAQKYGKKIAGWQEVTTDGDDFQDKQDILAYVWRYESDQHHLPIGEQTASQGYSVVLSPAYYLYFDLAASPDPYEPGYYWATDDLTIKTHYFFDTFKTYSYLPIPNTMTPEAIAHIHGVQGQLWSENVISRERMDYLAFPKITALAEMGWTAATNINWNNFSHRLGTLLLPRLDNLGIKYRISPPGLATQPVPGNATQVVANLDFKDMLMTYTTNGSDPLFISTPYTTPFITTSNIIKMATFNTMGRPSRIANLNK